MKIDPSYRNSSETVEYTIFQCSRTQTTWFAGFEKIHDCVFDTDLLFTLFLTKSESLFKLDKIFSILTL